MSQESIDEKIERYRRDREAIKERMKERNQLFEKASLNYLSSLSKEVETIKRTKPLAEDRNNEFREQIANLYKRYEAGSVRLKQAIQKTNIEKINYNEYLIKVYPNYFTEEKRKLKEENQRLMSILQGFRQQVSNQPLQEIPPMENEQYDPMNDKIDQYLREDFYDQEQQGSQPQQSLPIGFQNQSSQGQKASLTKQQEQDFLQEFLMPQQGRK